MGMTVFSAPFDAQASISKTQAESIALSGPNPYASSLQSLKVRASYLVNIGYSDHPTNRYLDWIVDISPDRPFAPLGGGAHAAPSSPAPTLSPTVCSAGCLPSPLGPQLSQRFAWVMVNATTGAASLFGG
jgi:hypothetical protein